MRGVHSVQSLDRMMHSKSPSAGDSSLFGIYCAQTLFLKQPCQGSKLFGGKASEHFPATTADCHDSTFFL